MSLLLNDRVAVVCSATFQLMNLARLNYERGSAAPSLLALNRLRPREQGEGEGVRFCVLFTAVAVPPMTHTTGSAFFHKGHKSQRPVMTFTLSSRAGNALPLSAAPESQQKPPADSSFPPSHCFLWLSWHKLGILWHPLHACQLLPIHGLAKC